MPLEPPLKRCTDCDTAYRAGPDHPRLPDSPSYAATAATRPRRQRRPPARQIQRPPLRRGRCLG